MPRRVQAIRRQKRTAYADDLNHWRRVDSAKAMCLLTTIVLVACAVLVAAWKFSVSLP